MSRRRSRYEPTPAELGPAALVPDLSVAAPWVRIGDLLVHSGVVTREALELASSHSTGERIGTLLLERGMVGEDDVTRALSEQLHVPVVDLRDASPDAAATAMIESADAHQHDVLPLVLTDEALTVAVADPLDPGVMTLLRSLPVKEVHVALGTPSQVRNRVNQTYSALTAVMGHVEEFQAGEINLDDETALEEASDSYAPVVQVVNKIVTQALRDRASDVHLEPSEDSVRVRFRVDGALTEVMELPSAMGQALVSRIKIMADMNIVERRRPQDGQFEMNIDGNHLDVRVSTTSTIWGEKTVLRLLDRTRSLYALGDLGMPPDSEELYSRLVNSPYGMIIVGGPTGSGKTTTLYATLSEINRPDINVMTIEDPVEYIFKKVNQIQIHEQSGMTFATGLKSILRQDPDVILVGEVRDVETARIAVQSALTGHRVFSSVHAIDAVSSLYRLLDMGIEPFLITSAIVGVVAQRLVRRICASCAEPFEPSLSDVTLYTKLGGNEKKVWIRGKGCQFCSNTGYFDRVGVYEVLAITDELRQCVVDGAPPRAARELAAQQGLRTLQDEAIRMVEDNVTTMEEIMKHVIVGEEF